MKPGNLYWSIPILDHDVEPACHLFVVFQKLYSLFFNLCHAVIPLELLLVQYLLPMFGSILKKSIFPLVLGNVFRTRCSFGEIVRKQVF